MPTIISEFSRLKTYIQKNFPDAYSQDKRLVDTVIEIVERFDYLKQNSASLKLAIEDSMRINFLEQHRDILLVREKPIPAKKTLRECVDEVRRLLEKDEFSEY